MVSAKDCKILSSKDLDTFASENLTRQCYAGKNFTIGIVICSAGGARPPHVHETQEEMLYVVSGNAIYEFLPDGGKYLVGPGDIIHVPAGVEHAVYVQGYEPWKVVAVYSPPGAEQHAIKGEIIVPKGTPHDYKFSFENGKYKVKK